MKENITLYVMKDNTINELKLISFLKQIDNIFPVSLSQKVNIEDYAKKQLTHGVVICADISGKIVGILLGYANDTLNKRAYIGTIGIVTECQSKGIGKKLIDEMKQYSKKMGMDKIGLHTHKTNSGAIRFYTREGFRQISELNSERKDDVYLEFGLL